MRSKRQLLRYCAVLLLVEIALVVCAFTPNWRYWRAETQPARAAHLVDISLVTAGIVALALLAQTAFFVILFKRGAVYALKWTATAISVATILIALASARWCGFGIAIRHFAAVLSIGGRVEFNLRLHNRTGSVAYHRFEIHLQRGGSIDDWGTFVNLWTDGALWPAFRYDGYDLTVGVPFVWLLLFTGVPTVILWRLDRRRPCRGACSSCGYDLTGNVSGRCPECGATCTAQSVRT